MQDFQAFRPSNPRLRAVCAHSSHKFPRHTHDEFGIGLIVKGAQVSASGRGQVIAEPGNIITVNPGEVHDGAPIGEHGRQWLMIYMEPEYLEEMQADLQETGQVEFEKPVFDNPGLAVRFQRAIQAMSVGSDPVAEMVLEESLLCLLAPLIAWRSNQPRPKDHPSMQRVWQMICDDPTANPSLHDLAKVADASRFQTLRAFQAMTGLTPHAFILQQRANQARRLILSSRNSLADIAAACGYADQSHMTREFKRRYGLTPAAFRA
ncbi:AraC family transcriptional regulator [Agrobacterium vitis]